MDLTTGMSTPRPRRRRRSFRPPPATHSRLEFEIAGGDQAPAAARQVVAGLGPVMDDRRLEEVQLLVTELVTNCVRHAGIGKETSITVGLELTPSALHVAVSNPGVAFDVPGPPEPSEEPAAGGRGLLLVERLADRWGIDDVHEARVWFEVSRAAAGS
jgi:anti-sigma regulatory factor (Ser/Thr protein kinase)